jgi:putative transposase
VPKPICNVLPIAPSTYYAHNAREADPTKCAVRARRDEELKPEIQHVWKENFCVYGAKKVGRQMNRLGIPVARCTVAAAVHDDPGRRCGSAAGPGGA